MRHVSIQQLSAFVDGALTGVSRELVTRHLATCGHCQARHAGWRARSDALRQALSWQPDPRTLEEWSSRVELVLTAERKGLPIPEFTPALHPVIAPAAQQPPANMRTLLQHTPAPAPPAPAAMASPRPAPPPPPTYVAPPPPPPAPAPVYITPTTFPTAPPRAPEPAQFLASSAPGPPIPMSPAPESTWLEATTVPVSPPPPRIGSHDIHGGPNLHNPPPYVAPWAPPPQKPSSSVMRTALVIGALLALVILASPYLPDVIRIQVPSQWLVRLPRFEFVRNGGAPEPGKATPDPSLQLATSAPLVPQVVPPEPIVPLVDSAAIREASLRDSLARLSKALARAKAAKPKPKPRRAPPPEELEPDGWTEGDGELAPEHTTTVVPVRVQTSVSLVPSRPQPLPTPVPPAESESDPSWPLLCGEVMTFAGVPVEGARVELESPALVVRTDKRGRFCVACPPGLRVLRVEHAAFEPVKRAVELGSATAETRIWLTTPR